MAHLLFLLIGKFESNFMPKNEAAGFYPLSGKLFVLSLFIAHLE
jgi:hypothetical protein